MVRRMNKNIKELMGYNIKEEELSELGFTRIRIDEHSDLSESMGVFDLLNGQKTALVACPPIALYNVIITEKGKTPRNLS
jgi:hypothetical protein